MDHHIKQPHDSHRLQVFTFNFPLKPVSCNSQSANRDVISLATHIPGPVDPSRPPHLPHSSVRNPVTHHLELNAPTSPIHTSFFTAHGFEASRAPPHTISHNLTTTNTSDTTGSIVQIQRPCHEGDFLFLSLSLLSIPYVLFSIRPTNRHISPWSCVCVQKL